MKFATIVLFYSTLSFGAVHAASRTVKYVATASPARTVKHSYKAVKATAKVASFPVLHSKRTAHGLYKAGKQVF